MWIGANFKFLSKEIYNLFSLNCQLITTPKIKEPLLADFKKYRFLHASFYMYFSTIFSELCLEELFW